MPPSHRTRPRIGTCLAVIITASLLGAVPRMARADAGADRYALAALNLAAWLPPPPAAGSSTEAADIATFWSTRAAMQGPTPRGRVAAEDDVFDEQSVWQRFAAAAGAPATVRIAEAAPTLVTLMHKAQQNGDDLLKPMKQRTTAGGRVRPFVIFPAAPTCLEPVDIVPGHRDSDYGHGLKESGSYPSGHAFRGMLWGLLLAEMLPERADALLERGIQFGESRVLCGFHFASDVTAGRLAASGLVAALHANAQFAADLARARDEVRKLSGLPASSH